MVNPHRRLQKDIQISRIHGMLIILYIHIRRVSAKYFTGGLCSQGFNVIDLNHNSQYNLLLWGQANIPL